VTGLIALTVALMLVVAPAGAAAIEPLRGSIEVAFTPWDDAEGALLRAVRSARHAIYVQAYLLTSRSLAKTLIEARQSGIAVQILADHDMTMKSEGGSQIALLAAAGIPVFIETRYAAAHNKIILVDPEDAHCAVLTGSYNFTFSAQARNAENLLIIRDNPELAMAYLNNWRRHRIDAQALAEALPALH
jgi:phosphatidylserine/phosphatidylglycerophosphate/cardiolipin synthase-like enzyme